MALGSGCASSDGKSDTERQLIEANKDISQKIDEVAEATDIFIADKRYTGAANKTRVSIHNNVTLNEAGKRKYVPHVAVRLHLPNVQEKIQLRFTSYDEDDMERGINRNRYHAMSGERNFGSSLAFFQELGKVKSEFRPRLEFGKGLETSHVFAFWSNAKAGAFNVEPELQLFGRSDTGTGQFFALNVEYQLTPVHLLTLVNEEQYTDGDNTMTTNHGLVWAYTHSPKTAWENSVIFESSNRTRYHLERYVYRTSFAYKLRKNILHYKLTPYVTCEKVDRFHPRPALDLDVEVIF